MNCEVAGTPDTAAMQEGFIDLICQDDDLLRAEFDALIAASWHTPPDSPPPAPPRRPPPGAQHPPTPAVNAGQIYPDNNPERRHERRQRAPP